MSRGIDLDESRDSKVQSFSLGPPPFNFSTQPWGGRGIDLDFITKLNSFVIQNALPDITFFIDITVEEAKKRKEKNQFFNLDRIEISNDDFYQKVRNGYLYSAEKEKRFFRIDGTKSIDEIHNEIKEKINFMLEVKRGIK